VIPLLSASQVTQISGVGHQPLAVQFVLDWASLTNFIAFFSECCLKGAEHFNI
jgi:hypothetical protein